jgi:cobalt-precorrin 5A hydrolase/precorrin-3B C17-methyltransferase
MKPAIVTFAASGTATAARLAPLIGAEIVEGTPQIVRRLFADGRPIIGICAAGILIRLLAPMFTDKHTEPPVLAVSQGGAHIVPLLGGHHGANRLAREIAAHLGGTAALTTASDSKFARGLDEPPEGIVLENPHRAKTAMATALHGDPVAATGATAWLHDAGYTIVAGPDPLIYHARTLVAGIGGERGVAAAEVIGLIAETLASADLSPSALAALATIDLKSDEAAFHSAATHFGVPLRIYTAAELNQERDRLVNPSSIVEAETGTPGVAEAAALKAGALVVPKRKTRRATCAIGQAGAPIDPNTLGRAPGLLHVVGIGPGDRASRSAAAVAALDSATDWVGYDLYLDLIADLRFTQHEHRFPLGDEELRVRHALELAATGKTVALVCSGDAQIYAMASLVFELIEAGGSREVTPAARRVQVEVHPGISAFQAASAAAGALIGHDFACISLSDLLTPTATIRQRLAAAASGDFVTALYNPRSQRRTDLLDHAKALFRQHRPSTVPVVIARSLGRPEQQITVTTISDFDPTTVDMLTIVLVGSSASRTIKRGNGTTVAFTPRGYDKKVVSS